MEIALDPAKAVKEYKEQIKDLEKKVDKYAKTVGKLTVERDCPPSCGVVASLGRAVGKLKSLDLLTKREMVQVQTKKEDTLLAPSRKHQLLGISRSYNCYTPVVINTKEAIKQRIKEISEDEFMCVYGEEKVYR